MARKLVSDWVKVATSGHTIDGRIISEKEIQDMADTYDTEEYTANIWYEHIRIFGNFGRVNEVKAEKDDKGRLCLFAKLAPSDDLIYLNTRGQKLFTSIEIQPNFAETGKSYLAGLAVTDNPASLGTTELQFNRKQQQNNYFSSPVEIGQLAFSAESQNIITKFIEKFSSKPEPEQEDDDMTPEQLEAITSAIAKQTQAMEAFTAQFSTLTDALDKKEPEPKAPAAPAEGGEETVSAKAFNELKESMDTLTKNFTDLQKEFKAALDTPSGQTPLGEQTGSDTQREVI